VVQCGERDAIPDDFFLRVAAEDDPDDDAVLRIDKISLEAYRAGLDETQAAIEGAFENFDWRVRRAFRDFMRKLGR